MDGRNVGRLVRAVRIHDGLTQAEVGRMASVSQAAVARVERGELRGVAFGTLERVTSALGITLRLDGRWHGGDGDRLIDGEHAAVVEAIVAELRRMGWEVLLEYTFNHYGERGSVDVVGWHAGTGALILVEVKSRLTDLQDLLASLGRKIRIVPDQLAEERGWDIVSVGRVVALPGSTANRNVVERHRAIFDASFPARAVEVRRWVRDPGGRAVAGVWFVASSRVLTTTHVRRVRKSAQRPPSAPGGSASVTR